MNKTEILEYIKQHLFLNLSTINEDGFPESRVMMNLRNKKIAPHLQDFFEESNKIYIMTNTSSSKVMQIMEEPISSLYFCDYEKFTGLLLMGTTTVVKSKKVKEELWTDDWEVYYKGGIKGGDFSILEFVPRKYKFYEDLSVKKGRISW